MALKTVKILADLIEPNEVVVNPDDDSPGVVAKIQRVRKRLRIALTIELEDGRTFEVGGSRFIDQVVAR
jgi:hypothetical protein